MLNNITLGQFYPADSAVHRMDPRFKIALTTAYIVAVFLVKELPAFLPVIAYLFAAARVSTVPFSYLWRGLKPLRFILIFTFVLNLLFATGQTPLFSLGFVTVTVEGLKLSVNYSLRLIFLVLGSSLLTLTTAPVTLTDGLERLLSPLRVVKFPAHEMAMMMTIALRFIPTLLEEADKIMKAQTARGADFESGNLMARAKAMVPLLVPLFVSAFRRAGDLAMAMEARCYHGGQGRTRLRALKAGRVDYLATAVTAALVALVSAWGQLW